MDEHLDTRPLPVRLRIENETVYGYKTRLIDVHSGRPIPYLRGDYDITIHGNPAGLNTATFTVLSQVDLECAAHFRLVCPECKQELTPSPVLIQESAGVHLETCRICYRLMAEPHEKFCGCLRCNESHEDMLSNEQ